MNNKHWDRKHHVAEHQPGPGVLGLIYLTDEQRSDYTPQSRGLGTKALQFEYGLLHTERGKGERKSGIVWLGVHITCVPMLVYLRKFATGRKGASGEMKMG